ncbi:MAG TPA: ABC transporter permease [Candidatus Limnocylindrales bacterium]|nr:ABC transporter permease [Candidatus Limnocylindrales bacterium]
MADMTAPVRPSSPPFATVLRAIGGIAAIGVKELRGRMRGRRAFIILTIYLLLLGGFALMVEQIMEQQFQNPFTGASATAGPAIGQAIFAAVLLLMTLQVVFLAPSSTAGAISLEREKQTLELLVTTPISSFAIVIGKLLSALVYVFLLIAASIPLMAVVFVFGGVGPEDIVRGYIVLIVTALGLGSFGILCSSLVKRTTASTAITIFGVLAITIGTVFLLVFWQAMGSFDATGNRRPGPLGIRTPYPLAWINPFLAQADVLCGTESTFGGGWCSVVQGLAPTTDNGVIINNGGGGGVGVPMPMPVPAVPEKGFAPGGAVAIDDQGNPIVNDVVAQPFGARQDTLWPKTVAMWLGISVFFILLSVQAVSPTRRWRFLRRPRRRAKSPESQAP